MRQIEPSVKVVIASGYSIDNRINCSLDVQASGYVGKPYILTDFLNTVRNVLDGEEK